MEQVFEKYLGLGAGAGAEVVAEVEVVCAS